MTVTAVVTTIGRPSLKRSIESLEGQSYKVTNTIIKDGPRDTIVKMAEALAKVKTDVLVWLDDDAVYPEDWVKSLIAVFKDPKVAYAAGTCLPLTMQDDSGSDAERCIAEVSSSFFGTCNMSQRHKMGYKVEERDETNLMGSGMYRASVMKEIFKHPEKVPPAFSETYIIQRMRADGWKTLYVPGGFFYHKQRSSIMGFARQIFRSGVGRMNYFRQAPKEAPKKFYIFGPMIFVVYLLLFFGLAMVDFPITNLPLLLYVSVLAIVSFGLNKHKSKWLPFYYLTLHLSYGIGMLYGLFRTKRTWT